MTTNKPEVFRFHCHGQSAPAYSCNKPADNSGEYVRLSDYEALQAACEKLRKDAAAALIGLPDSLPMEPYQTVDRGSPHYKAGWNACRRAMLDALEKLMEDPIHDQ